MDQYLEGTYYRDPGCAPSAAGRHANPVLRVKLLLLARCAAPGAIALRTPVLRVEPAAPTAIALFAARRASEVAQFLTKDLYVSLVEVAASFRGERQKNDQVGAGQLAFLVATRD